jgi:hypothetical protein
MEETMAQTERRRMPTELSEVSSGAAETAAAEPAEKVVSAMTASGDAWIERQAELLEHVDQLSKRWLQNRREAIDATRQSFAEVQRARDLTDLMRVQQEWFSGSLQRFASDFEALTSISLSYSRRSMMWLGETAQAAQESVQHGEQVTLSTAGAKPSGSEKKR